GKQPLRVVMDSRGRTPAQAKMLREPGTTLIFASNAASQAQVEALRTAGAEVIVVPGDATGRVDPASVFQELGKRGIVNLLVEGGGTLLGSLFDAGLVDKVFAFIAPVIIGGREAASPVEGCGVARMAEAWRMASARMQQVGADWLVVGYPRAGR
ncbi:MAG: riboflavin biosynthesis protein RibD, partial [SAR202 cluster bacterium]|nr:riboflavin biosynthesis protein RibD [SAR202 cluster bacterium]